MTMCIMTLLAYRRSLQRESCGFRPLTLNVAILLVLFTLIGMPCASPFGSEAGSMSSPNHHRVTTSISPTELSLKKDNTGKRFQVMNIWNTLRLHRNSLSPTIEQDDWKYGELKAGIISRLFYLYAEPLLDLSSKRQLEMNDAFYTPDQRKMGVLVPSLQNIYNQCRLKSRKRLEAFEASSESAGMIGTFDLEKRMKDRIDRSKALTLAKAIFIHQKDAFIKTGMLRFTNTVIQAFPAIMVSRLLRLIELGEANNPSKALFTATSLVILLSLKMIIENKYFYNVVKCATEIRGTVMGMIFDKSLQVSCFATAGEREKGETKTLPMETPALGSGSVINLMQSDATVIETLALQVHTLWDGLLQVSLVHSSLNIGFDRCHSPGRIFCISLFIRFPFTQHYCSNIWESRLYGEFLFYY